MNLKVSSSISFKVLRTLSWPSSIELFETVLWYVSIVQSVVTDSLSLVILYGLWNFLLSSERDYDALNAFALVDPHPFAPTSFSRGQQRSFWSIKWRTRWQLRWKWNYWSEQEKAKISLQKRQLQWQQQKWWWGGDGVSSTEGPWLEFCAVPQLRGSWGTGTEPLWDTPCSEGCCSHHPVSWPRGSRQDRAWGQVCCW